MFGYAPRMVRRWVGVPAVVALAIALLPAALIPASTVAVAPTCFGQPATIVGAGTIQGTPGNDVIVGSSGPDEIWSNGGDDTICALGGNDVIHASIDDYHSSKVDAGDGNDTISTGINAIKDVLLGGSGADSFYVGSGGNPEIHGGSGGDHVIAGSNNDITAYGDSGGDVLDAHQASFARLYGGSGTDRLISASFNSVLDGGSGHDTCGGGGTNTITNCEA